MLCEHIKTTGEDCHLYVNPNFPTSSEIDTVKIPMDKKIEPSFLLVIPKSYVPTILYQCHDSLSEGHQGVTRMYSYIKREILC